MARNFLMAVFMVLSMVAAVGCGMDDAMDSSVDPGGVQLAITLPDGSNISSVHYAISGNGITPIEGNLPVDALGATISGHVVGIPQGTGYTLTLTATASDGATCMGTSPFDIVAAQTALVHVFMNCTEVENDGNIELDAEVNICPEITRMTIAPLVTTVGNKIAVTSMATDNDNDPIAFAWTATRGAFDAPSAANTNYNCQFSGIQTLTLTVDDGQGCTDAQSYNVNCLPMGVCGNGNLELGEECDDANIVPGDGCDQLCFIEECGDGVLNVGEQCDDGNVVSNDGCDSMCRVEGCGNGILNGTEQCDDGNIVNCDGCNEACRLETCGNGIQECNEACDDGNMIPDDGCEPNCTLSPTCTDCENAQCTNYGGENLVTACYAGSTAAACNAFVQCARANDCASVHPNKCFCGTVSEMMCMVPGNANGPCIPETQAAAGNITDPELIATRFMDPDFAIGDAAALLLCNKERCNPICL